MVSLYEQPRIISILFMLLVIIIRPRNVDVCNIIISVVFFQTDGN